MKTKRVVSTIAPVVMALSCLLPQLALAAGLIEYKLFASDKAAFDGFGGSVSVSGDVALVGASGNDDNGSNSGSAYIYRHGAAGWVQEQKLTASDGQTGDQFGNTVSVSGDVALVGAKDDDDKGLSAGAAYVFRYNGTSWVEEQKQTASDGAAGDSFGNGAAVSGDVALVGANGDDDRGSLSGSAYAYRFDGTSWTQTQKLTPGDGALHDQFGHQLALSGEVALISGVFDDDRGLNADDDADGVCDIDEAAVASRTTTTTAP